jgi:hypothetical protein
MTKAYGATVLIGGGTGALDRSEIDGDNLTDLDMALVNTANILYPYWLDDDSAAAESSPTVISPDTNAGTKRWILQSMHMQSLTLETALTVAQGGTGASSASITAFNNITGYTASGATGTTSTNLVFSTSPTLVTPLLGTPTSGNLTNCTAYEGSAILSTGEAGGTKFLREDGDGTCSWQAASGGASAIDELSDATTPTTNNIGIGSGTLSSITPASGNWNTGLGIDAGKSITTGDSHTCVGFSAGKVITTGLNLTAIGAYAGFTATGNYNTLLGYGTGYAQTIPQHNTCVGWSAGFYNVTGASNTLVGSWAGRGISANSYDNNTFLGFSVGLNVTTGSKNVLIGSLNGDALTTGANNVAVGYNGVSFLTTGINNTIIGDAAAITLTTGSNNICLGKASNVSASGAASQIVIGVSYSGTADTRVHIGNGTSHIYADYNSASTWTHSSDRRQKRNIMDDTLGLDFINNLRTVTYQHKAPSEFPMEWTSYNSTDTKAPDKVIHGFIAQEVKEALDMAGVDTFAGWDKMPDGREAVSYEVFVLPLIRATQELSNRIKELEAKCKDN